MSLPPPSIHRAGIYVYIDRIIYSQNILRKETEGRDKEINSFH